MHQKNTKKFILLTDSIDYALQKIIAVKKIHRFDFVFRSLGKP